MNSKQLRIVYMGTPDFAVAPLRRLVEGGYNIVGVLTSADKPAGRGLKVHESAVKQYAASVGLHILQPERLKNPEFVEQFAALDADLAIVIAFRMLPEVVWSQPRMGTFNLHASLLPQYRGAAPINWAIINGEKQSGVTTFMLNHEIDKGAIIGQTKVAIGANESAGTLHDKLMEVGTELVVETIEKIAAGVVVPIEQSSTDMVAQPLMSAPKIFKENCLIDWTLPVQNIYDLIRGLSPYPAAWTQIVTKNEAQGEAIVMKIFTARHELCNHKMPIGAILSDSRSYLKVACKDGYICVDELQIAGKRRMEVAEFLRGFKGIEDFIAQKSA